eukprot:7408885-Prorocentrum_lima.AAC.1
MVSGPAPPSGRERHQDGFNLGAEATEREGTHRRGREGEVGRGSWRGCPPSSAHPCWDQRSWLRAGVRMAT